MVDREDLDVYRLMSTKDPTGEAEGSAYVSFARFETSTKELTTTTGRRNIEMCGGNERFEFTFKTL